MMKKLTEEDLKNQAHVLRVGDLKKILNECNLPDDAIVMVERVEDKYFTKYGWGVFVVKTFNSFPFYSTNYSEFIPAWWAVKENNKHLLITVHY